MPTTIDDIIAARNAAVDILNHEIQDALAKQNAATNQAAANRFDEWIHQLMTQRVAIFEQAANDAMDSDEMTAALNKLRGLTSDMSTIAARMGSVTGFFNNISSFISAASQVAGTVQGS
jgi:ABC-type transporter Mla subunit MlaD